MTQEDKELLLKDISARLPYGVKISKIIGDLVSEPRPIRSINLNNIIVEDGEFEDGTPDIDVWNYEEIKPYLFPLSSMTEEQKQEYTYIVNYLSPDDTENWQEGEFVYVGGQMCQLMHFFHMNHLDYRGLIPMGLAINATGLNIY